MLQTEDDGYEFWLLQLATATINVVADGIIPSIFTAIMDFKLEVVL